MIPRVLFILAIAVGCGFTPGLQAQSTNPPISLHDQLQAIVFQVQAKAQAGKTEESDYQPEIATLDSLIASHKGLATEDAAQVMYMKAVLYLEVIPNPAKGASILRQVATNYPNTDLGRNAAHVAANVESQLAAMAAKQKIHDALAVGMAFPDFAVTNLEGGALSVGAFKGHLVLVDFWATWCPPCRMELPDVIALYAKYHPQGFEIVGVTLDDDRNELNNFLKEQKGMTWPQYYDGQKWSNSLVLKYGIEVIPSNFLVGPDGKILGKDLHGEVLEQAVTRALAAK